MRINGIKANEVNVILSADELTMFANLMYYYKKNWKDGKEMSKPNERFYGTYAQILTARDLCQYGHLDSFTLDRLLELNLQACPENQAADRMLMLMGEIAKLGVIKADELIKKLKSAEDAIEDED